MFVFVVFALCLLSLHVSFLEAKIFKAKYPECRDGQSVNIALMGDSLNHRPYQYLQLPQKIHNALKIINPNITYNLTYFETAADGSKIIDILTQQVPPVCQQAATGFKFDTILMFWDTGTYIRISF